MTATPLPTEAPQPPQEQLFGKDPDAIARQIPVNLFEKAICLKLDMGKLGASKKLGASQIQVDADKDRISASKSILDSPELRAIAVRQSRAADAIKKLCLPSMFKAGIFLIPIASIKTVDEILVTAQTDLVDNLIPAFLMIYPALVERDKISLRSTFNPADYPPIAKVKSAFYFDWSYINFGVPKALEAVDSDLFIREQEKAAKMVVHAAEQIQDVLRGQMLDLVSHLSDKLSGGRGDGKPKIFRDSAVENVREFLKTFRDRNIVDDNVLEDLCNRAGQLLEGVDAQALRDSDVARDKVRAGFDDIKANLDGMLVNKPGRMIRFSTDDPPEPAGPTEEGAAV